MVQCEFADRPSCVGDIPDTRADGVYRLVCGWAKNRSGGGDHGLSGRKEAHRYAHRECVEVFRYHERPASAGEQESLL